MNIQPHVVFRGLHSTPALTARIDEEIGQLEELFDGIISCHVAVEVLNHRHRSGRHVHVRVELVVPGKTLVVGREPVDHQDHQDPMTAINEAFPIMQRQLREFERERHGHHRATSY